MKGITWSRDSHGLFDYESRHLTKRTMKTSSATSIIRKQNELELLPHLTVNTDDGETKQLLKIVNDNGTDLSYFLLSIIEVFYLESFSQLNSSRVESREINENMYLVVRSLKNNNQKIVRKHNYSNQYRTMRFSRATF
jgi:hypothetical protein